MVLYHVDAFASNMHALDALNASASNMDGLNALNALNACIQSKHRCIELIGCIKLIEIMDAFDALMH